MQESSPQSSANRPFSQTASLYAPLGPSLRRRASLRSSEVGLYFIELPSLPIATTTPVRLAVLHVTASPRALRQVELIERWSVCHAGALARMHNWLLVVDVDSLITAGCCWHHLVIHRDSFMASGISLSVSPISGACNLLNVI
jgi:hypothetical protein